MTILPLPCNQLTRCGNKSTWSEATSAPPMIHLNKHRRRYRKSHRHDQLLSLRMATFWTNQGASRTKGSHKDDGWTVRDQHNGVMRHLLTALIASCALTIPVHAAEPVPLVVIPFDAAWGSRRVPVKPAAVLPPPPVPAWRSDTGAQVEPTPRRQGGCRGGC